jgi:hypothetical protein
MKFRNGGGQRPVVAALGVVALVRSSRYAASGWGRPSSEVRMAPRTCRICGRDLPPGKYFTRGCCQMCANYWLRHGVERPPQPPGQLARPGPPPQACIHCGRLAQQRARGRCMACYQYRRRYGVERPLQPRPVRPPHLCTHCGQPTPKLTRGRCQTCYQYWHRHGVERSLAPRLPQPCQTCGQLGPSLRHGRCPACYMYWYRRGVERPAALRAGGRR